MRLRELLRRKLQTKMLLRIVYHKLHEWWGSTMSLLRCLIEEDQCDLTNASFGSFFLVRW